MLFLKKKQKTEVDALAGFKYSDNIHYVISLFCIDFIHSKLPPHCNKRLYTLAANRYQLGRGDARLSVVAANILGRTFTGLSWVICSFLN